MIRSEIWLAHVAKKPRPVLILTRTEVIDVRKLVTVAEITTSIRGLAAEVTFDHAAAGLDHPSAINCDGLHTISQASLTPVVERWRRLRRRRPAGLHVREPGHPGPVGCHPT